MPFQTCPPSSIEQLRAIFAGRTAMRHRQDVHLHPFSAERGFVVFEGSPPGRSTTFFVHAASGDHARYGHGLPCTPGCWPDRAHHPRAEGCLSSSLNRLEGPCRRPRHSLGKRAAFAKASC